MEKYRQIDPMSTHNLVLRFWFRYFVLRGKEISRKAQEPRGLSSTSSGPSLVPGPDHPSHPELPSPHQQTDSARFLDPPGGGLPSRLGCPRPDRGGDTAVAHP